MYVSSRPKFTRRPQEVMQRVRDDRVTETDQRETFQSVAPAVEDGLYLVPKVIE